MRYIRYSLVKFHGLLVNSSIFFVGHELRPEAHRSHLRGSFDAWRMGAENIWVKLKME